MSRRISRRATLTGAAAIIAAAGVRDTAGAEAPLTLRSGPHLFLDDYLIQRTANVTRRIRSPERQLSRPVVTGPEDKNFQPYVTVVRDPQSRRFRMWYNVPVSTSQSHLAYLESEDGVRWIRPHRVLKDPDTIQFGAAVVDEGPDCAEPARRFKFGWWHGGGLKVAASRDGLEWQMLAPGVVVPHNHDINSIHWDPIRKRYTAFVSFYTEGPKWKGQRRHTYQTVSRDLVEWEKPWPIIMPDDSADPGETQFYCMSGMLARGDLLVGMLKVLRDDLPADPGGPVAGIGYTVLAWSRDGKTWTRDREPFFDRDPRPGTWDHAMTWADCQLPVGDEVFIYYGGYARGHKVDRFTERQIGLVRVPRDRYVAREAGEMAGTLLTHPLVIKGSRLAVNSEARGGELRARVLDQAGKQLPGLGLAECEPITGDTLAAPLRWRGSLRRALEQPIRLEFSLRNAKLYALNVQ